MSVDPTKRCMLIVSHTYRPEAIAATAEVVNALVAACVVPVFDVQDHEDFAPHVNMEHTATLGVDVDLASLEAAFVLGGDGTILRAAELLRGSACPIVGVNLGHVGFLAEMESFDLGFTVEQVLAGNYKVEERMALEVCAEYKGEVLANTLAPGALAPQRRTDLANYAGIEVGDPQPRAQGMLRHRLRAREAVRGAIRAAVLAGDRPGDTVTVRPLNDCPLTHEKPAALDAGPGRQRADPLRAMERVAIHRQRQAAPAGMRRSAADLSAHTDDRAGAAPSSQHTQEMRWRPIPPSAATMRAPKCGGPRSMRSVATEAA